MWTTGVLLVLTHCHFPKSCKKCVFAPSRHYSLTSMACFKRKSTGKATACAFPIKQWGRSYRCSPQTNPTNPTNPMMSVFVRLLLQALELNGIQNALTISTVILFQGGVQGDFLRMKRDTARFLGTDGYHRINWMNGMNGTNQIFVSWFIGLV